MVAAAVLVTDLKSRQGRAFLKSVAASSGGWRMVVLPRNEWRVAFIREAGYGESAEIVTSERVAVERPVRDTDSRVTQDDVECSGAWLLGNDAATAASLILDGWTFRIRHHPGSETASDMRLHVIEFVAVHPSGRTSLAIGGVTIIDVDMRRTVIGGACSATNR